MVFLPSFSRCGLARIPFVCVQEGSCCQFSNTAHSQQVAFPILPFIKPVNHSGSSGCGEGESNKNLSVRMHFNGSPVQHFHLLLECPLHCPANFQEPGAR